MKGESNKKFPTSIITNEEGLGLIMAIFIVVILGTFGTLIARFAGTGAEESAEEYLWAQSLYAAESAAQLRILTYDGGGNGGPAGTFTDMTIENFDIETPTDIFGGRRIPATLAVSASKARVSRTVEIKFRL